jgi:hypothetical protein
LDHIGKILVNVLFPCYYGWFVQYIDGPLQIHKFGFVLMTSIDVLRVPSVLETWHVQEGINLSQYDIKFLEQACF